MVSIKLHFFCQLVQTSYSAASALYPLNVLSLLDKAVKMVIIVRLVGMVSVKMWVHQK